MSERLWHLLSGKLDEIAAFYKVRPRITLIVRVPGKPREGVFLSDDNWSDAVATVKYLSGDGGTFAAGSPEPPAECPAPPPRDEVREAAEPAGFDPICPRCGRPLSDHHPDANNDPVCGDFPTEPAPALPNEVREAAEAFRKVNSAQRDDSCTDAGCIVCKRREAGDRLLAALAARKRGDE